VRSALLPKILGNKLQVELLNSAHIRAGKEKGNRKAEDPGLFAIFLVRMDFR
jgi:hypothetical protein